MKVVTGFMLACALWGAGCSRSEKGPEVTVTPTPPPSLRADAENLQLAQQNAAAAHQRANSPKPSPP